MRVNRVVAPLAGCILAGAASMLVACSGEDSGSPAVSSFHYVETVMGNIDGDPLNSRDEGWYQVPIQRALSAMLVKQRWCVKTYISASTFDNVATPAGLYLRQ